MTKEKRMNKSKKQLMRMYEIQQKENSLSKKQKINYKDSERCNNKMQEEENTNKDPRIELFNSKESIKVQKAAYLVEIHNSS